LALLLLPLLLRLRLVVVAAVAVLLLLSCSPGSQWPLRLRLVARHESARRASAA